MNDELRSALSELYTHLPGVVIAYDGITVTAKPALPKLLANGDILAAPQIVRVPVKWPVGAGGKAMITVPLFPGDAVELAFSCRSIENWLNGSDGPPDDPRQFDLTDAFCTPVMRPGVGAADTENVNVQYGSGSMKISADGTITFAGTAAIFNLPTTFNKLMTFTEGFTGSGTATHNGKNIDSTHRHSGVQTGSGNTGAVV